MTMMQLHNLLCSFTLRKLASIWPRPGDRGEHLIGQRAIVNVPGQREGNITLCAAISLQGLLHHHASLGPYNTAHMIIFPNTLDNDRQPCLFCKQWKRHAETLTWGQSWVGYDTQGNIFPVAWPGKILLVMWMR